MKKRTVALFLVSFLAILLLSACGRAGTPSGSVARTASPVDAASTEAASTETGTPSAAPSESATPSTAPAVRQRLLLETDVTGTDGSHAREETVLEDDTLDINATVIEAPVK